MGVKKLLDKLNRYLSNGDTQKAIRCDEIDTILVKLSKKEQRLRKKLDKEKNKSKRKKLGMEVRIVSLQLKKGKKRREELSDRCK